MRNFGSGVVEICSWNKLLLLNSLAMSVCDVSTIKTQRSASTRSVCSNNVKHTIALVNRYVGWIVMETECRIE